MENFLEEFFKGQYKRPRAVKSRIFLTGFPPSGSPCTSQRFPMIFMGATRKLTEQGCPVTSLCKRRAAHAKIAIPHCSSYLWLPRKLPKYTGFQQQPFILFPNYVYQEFSLSVAGRFVHSTRQPQRSFSNCWMNLSGDPKIAHPVCLLPCQGWLKG